MADDSDRRGGSGSGRKKKEGGGGAAAVVLLALIGVVIASNDRGSPTGGTPLARARAAAHRGDGDAAWRALSLTGSTAATDRTSRCAANSFGQVRTFFLRTPCRLLQRELLGVHDDKGNMTFLAINWISMRTTAEARRLKALLDSDGSGDISPIGATVLRGQHVRFSGAYYASRQDGSVLVVAESTAVRGRPSSTLLHQVADVGAEFPTP
ncbi:MAG TPA: hypothetical protein VMU51_33685 [Mycobacteriales bacterium]|nr:hypothetical protein [Mycobacteriales bacterium]